MTEYEYITTAQAVEQYRIPRDTIISAIRERRLAVETLDVGRRGVYRIEAQAMAAFAKTWKPRPAKGPSAVGEAYGEATP